MSPKKEPELQINTSLKSAGAFFKVFIAGVGALGLGAAGSSIATGKATQDTDQRILALEQACQSYAVRLATSEAKVDGVQVTMVDIKKDLTEIRTTQTQILFLLRRSK